VGPCALVASGWRHRGPACGAGDGGQPGNYFYFYVAGHDQPGNYFSGHDQPGNYFYFSGHDQPGDHCADQRPDAHAHANPHIHELFLGGCSVVTAGDLV